MVDPPVVDGDFVITAVSVGEDLTITFTSEPGASYEIQVSDDLTEFTAAGEVEGTGSSTSYTLSVEPDQAARYVRVAKK